MNLLYITCLILSTFIIVCEGQNAAGSFSPKTLEAIKDDNIEALFGDVQQDEASGIFGNKFQSFNSFSLLLPIRHLCQPWNCEKKKFNFSLPFLFKGAFLTLVIFN